MIYDIRNLAGDLNPSPLIIGFSTPMHKQSITNRYRFISTQNDHTITTYQNAKHLCEVHISEFKTFIWGSDLCIYSFAKNKNLVDSLTYSRNYFLWTLSLMLSLIKRLAISNLDLKCNEQIVLTLSLSNINRLIYK